MTRNHSPAFWLMASELILKFQYVMKCYTKLQTWTGSLGCPALTSDLDRFFGMSCIKSLCYLECLDFVG